MNTISKAASKLAKADRKVTHEAAQHRDAPVVKAFGALSEGADQPPLLLLGVGTMVVGALLRQPVMLRTGARMLASEAVATGIKSIIKRSVDRTRPKKAIETGKHDFKPGDNTAHDESSFPSGHTAGAVAVAGALAKDVPALGAPAYALASGVAAVQMPRGKHYVLDTVAGAVVGFVAQRAANTAVRLAERALVGAIRRRRRHSS
ncbi:MULTISPECIES: phosphatase PAP2 family protein [unclassified Sphingomonas]|uniref:phosphatase PAP2 family protein n=1 Tax=unclassified Sphingomonas TaxID=196159 RepID=UPI0002896F08|nr:MULTISPECIES: phosphatase PAP2 family protein [unclassified Sphingomonas]